MQNTYQREYLLRTSDFDEKVHLQPFSVLDLFQCVAGGHAEELGIGFKAMLEQNLLWVVTREKYVVEKQPPMHSAVRVRTWPLKPGSIGFQREYIIETLQGETLVRGSSEWMIIDSRDRKLQSVKDVYPVFEEGHCTDRALDGRLRRIRNFEGETGEYIIPGRSCLDMNGHVNNAKYANFVIDSVAMGESESIASLQMDFHKEVMAGEKLRVDSLREDNVILAKGVGEDGEVRFFCRIELSEVQHG